MKKILLLVVLVLAGCGKIVPSDVEKATELCAGHGGWTHFNMNGVSDTHRVVAECSNGVSAEITYTIPPRKVTK